MLSNLIKNSYSFMNMGFASLLGGVNIASVAFVSPMFNVLNAIGLGLTTGGVGMSANADLAEELFPLVAQI